MYQSKKDNKKQEKSRPLNDERLELSLDKALETIKQQALSYQDAGMTHISSLLD